MYDPNNDQGSPPADQGAVIRRVTAAPIEVIHTGPASLGALAPTHGQATRLLWRLLQQKWIVLLVAVAVFVPCIAAVWTFVKPLYSARAEIRVRPIIPVLVYRTEENGMIPLYQSYLNTQVSIIRSPEVIKRVVESREVLETSWHKNPPHPLLGATPSSVERLREELEVRPRAQTEIIDISVATLRPEDAATLVNATVDEYVKLTGEIAGQTSDILYRKLADEYKALRDEIDSRQLVVAKLRKELGTGDPQELVARRRVRLDEAEARLEELNRRIALGEWQQKELADLRASATQEGEPKTATPATETPAGPPKPQYEADGEWRRLYMAVKTAEHQLELEGAQLGKQHPRMVTLRSEAEFAAKLLSDRQTMLDAGGPQAAATLNERAAVVGIGTDIGALAREVKQLHYEQSLLVGDADKQRADWELAFDRAQVLTKEMETIRQKQELYTAVRTRLEQKEMERNVPGSIEILTRAFAPTRPSTDRRVLLSIMSLLGGLACGLGLAFVRVNRDQSIYAVEEVANAPRVPFLGYLPLIDDTTTPESSPVLAEGIRMVRTAVLQWLGDVQGNTLLITSPGPSVGKTTVAMMLARSLSHCGRKVLLVDCDIYNSAVARRMGLEKSPGLLGTILKEIGENEGIVAMDDRGLLNVLPSGAGGDRAFDPELLANGAFTRCMADWRQNYDFVIVDSPPVLAVADAPILARHADGVLMVVREGSCERGELYSAMTMLGNPANSLLGTVFIGSPRSQSYGYGYGYGYGKYGKYGTKA